MKKKQYEMPSMEVAELKQRSMLLASSPDSDQLNDLTDYEDQDDPFSF